MVFNVYTDGACSGNPGIGGWGVVIQKKGEKPVYINGGTLNTTNNQMELTAAIKALKYFSTPAQINLFTDSKYLKEGIEKWIINWKKNGWKTKSKKQVKNKELWIELDNQLTNHKINWHWIKAHAGNQSNEMADFLAQKFIEENK